MENIPQLLQTKEPSLSRLQCTEDVDAHWVQAVPGGGGGDETSSSIGSTGDWGRDGSPVRESEEEAWSDGGGVWMAADMIWGRGEGGLRWQGWAREIEYIITSQSRPAHSGNPRLDNPVLLSNTRSESNLSISNQPSNYYAFPSRQRCSFYQGRPRPRANVFHFFLKENKITNIRPHALLQRVPKRGRPLKGRQAVLLRPRDPALQGPVVSPIQTPLRKGPVRAKT